MAAMIVVVVVVLSIVVYHYEQSRQQYASFTFVEIIISSHYYLFLLSFFCGDDSRDATITRGEMSDSGSGGGGGADRGAQQSIVAVLCSCLWRELAKHNHVWCRACFDEASRPHGGRIAWRSHLNDGLSAISLIADR